VWPSVVTCSGSTWVTDLAERRNAGTAESLGVRW
jgi:hypothetical protein